MTTARYALDAFQPTDGWDWSEYTPEQREEISRNFTAACAEEIGKDLKCEVIYHHGWTAQATMSFHRGEWINDDEDISEIVNDIITAVAQGERGRDIMIVTDRGRGDD